VGRRQARSAPGRWPNASTRRQRPDYAIIAANLGALELLGQAANGAQYDIATVHFYWIGAVPAMVFLGLVMMPFYYGAKVRSVPESLRLRFNEGTHAFNAATFAVGTVLIAGVNLFALALVVHLMLGWSIDIAILVAAGIVLTYITLGGLTSAIYNEVLQFFVILASLIPLTVVGLHHVAVRARDGSGARRRRSSLERSVADCGGGSAAPIPPRRTRRSR
jgi:Na+/proline symporter